MSREKWFKDAAPQKKLNGETLKDLFDSNTRTTLKPTDDPDVALWEEAIELFENGTRLARLGDLAAASPQIACAYLLDGRSIKFIVICKEGDRYKNQFIDYELVTKLIQRDVNSFASMVLVIMLGHFLGTNSVYGQAMIGQAFQAIEGLLEAIDQNPGIEKKENHILGGCLTRPILLYQRSSLHMAMGNLKKATKDLTKALAIDEHFTSAREARASVWASSHLKDRKTVHNEFNRVIKEVHPDNRGNEVYYAWLAMTILDDPNLGTKEDVMAYYKQSLKAKYRRNELYGPRSKSEEPPVVQVLEQRLQLTPDIQNFLKSLAEVQNGFDGISIKSGVESSKVKRCCVKCGISEGTKGKLMQCSRCKLAYYCSKDCQKADWKSHKEFCKTVSKQEEKAKSTTSTTSPKPSSIDVSGKSTQSREDRAAKEELDSMEGNVGAAKRLHTELCKLYKEHGNLFADWWKGMSRSKKVAILKDVTYNTLYDTKPSFEEVRRDLSGNSPNLSRVLFEYNIKNLVGSCKCTGSCGHYYNETILHEMADWTTHLSRKEEMELHLCNLMKKQGHYPDLFGGNVAIVLPKEDGGFGDPMVFTDDAPDEVKQEYKDLIMNGSLYDASVAQFLVSRKVHSIRLLVKLFDEYQIAIRRCPTSNSVERLMGCRHCSRSCEDATFSRQCSTCKVAWFCCLGCMIAAGHETCPMGVECDSKVMFQ